MGIIERLRRLAKRSAHQAEVNQFHTFQAKYISFKELLAANTELLDIITDMEEALQGRRVFGMAYIQNQVSRAVFQSMRMIQGLNFISGQKYLSLLQALHKINQKFQSLLDNHKPGRPDALVLAYDQITKEMFDWVGGKNANLGEIRTALGMATPAGFAVTTLAFEKFMAHSRIKEHIAQKVREIDPDQPESIARTSAAIRAMIAQAALPPELAAALDQAVDGLAARAGGLAALRMAVRSSALGEDSDLSFAGQYKTVLNVTAAGMPEAYRQVVASLYTERAMMYRLTKGLREEDVAMGVACLQMVPAVASGVVYSRDPMDPRQPCVIINAVWGLGPYAVDGVITPDLYKVDRGTLQVVERQVFRKPVQLTMLADGGVGETAVEEGRQETPCLAPDSIIHLAQTAVRLEGHYGAPQDIEWALTPEGQLVILQTRPLPMVPLERMKTTPVPIAEGAEEVLAGSGLVVFPGIAHGPAFHVNSDEDLTRFPQGAVLIARRSSPRFVIAMTRAVAIVTEVGSITGHMASLAREFKVPTLLSVPQARAAIPNGTPITVDAYAGVVYRGRVESLIAMTKPVLPDLQRTPLYRILRQVADLIIPLHLTDPKSPDFKPQSCRTLHDIVRIVHELCYQEMFQLSDQVSYREGAAVKLNLPLPIDLYLIDLGGGLADARPGRRRVSLPDVRSFPLKELLRGLMHQDLSSPGPRPFEFSGFLAVMREQMFAPPTHVQRFGDRSYAIISDKYLNFSSRVGYHYSILDCYCGQSVSKNYITFSFKGGAADELRRNRRARAIARILEALDFAVEVRADRVDARLLKEEADIIGKKLEQIGCLLQFTRQMDMLMNNESSVEMAAHSFLSSGFSSRPSPSAARSGA